MSTTSPGPSLPSFIPLPTSTSNTFTADPFKPSPTSSTSLTNKNPQVFSKIDANNDESVNEQLLLEYLGRFHRIKLEEMTLPNVDAFVLKTAVEKLQDLASSFMTDFPILSSHVFSPSSFNDSNSLFSFPFLKKLFQFYQDLSIEIATYEVFLKNTWKSILSDALSFDLPDTEPHTTLPLPTNPSPLRKDCISTSFSLEDSAILWTKLDSLCEILSESHSGIVTCIATKTHLAVGTSHGIIHVFNESQKLKYSLDGKASPIPIASISSIAFSENEETLVSGYNDGTLCLWNLKTQTLIAQKLPVHSVRAKKLGHFKGSKILHLTFVGSSSKTFISSDNFGVAFYHTCVSTYLGAIETQAFFGTYRNRLNRQRFTTILSIVSLHDTYIAILTPYKMAILDTQPIQTLYRLLRVDSKAPDDPDTFLSGSLTYCSPYLCMTWANWIRIYQLDVQNQSKSKFDLINVYEKKMQAPISYMQKLDNYLVLLDDSKHFTFFCMTQLAPLETIHAPYLIGHDDLHQVSRNLTHHTIPNYSRCWTCSFHSMYTFDMHCIARGDLLSLESRFLAMANMGRFSDAIQLGSDLYHGRATNYVYSSSSKHQLDVVPFLCSMALTCLKSNQFNPDDHLSQLVHFLLSISADFFLFSDFYTYIQQSSFLNVFHSIMIQLLPLPSSHKFTSSFSTPFLQSFIDSHQWTEYERLLSYMDLSMIDMNKQMQLCEEHRLYMGLLHLHALKKELEKGFDHVLKLNPKIPFEFIFQACSRTLLVSTQLSEIIHWAQVHWVDLLQHMSPDFAFDYVKAVFHSAPSNQRSSLASSFIDLLDLNKKDLPFILIELLLMHTFKSHTDQFILSSEKLHIFFMRWTTLPCIPNHLPLDKFQEGLIFLLERLFFVPEQTTFQQVLDFAQTHQLWLVAEYIYTQLQQYPRLLDCYVFDLSRSHLTFHKFKSILQLCENNQSLFWDHVIELSPFLLKLNPIQFALTLNQFKAIDCIPPIFHQFQQESDSLSVLTFLDTLCKFSPSLLNAQAFLYCFEGHAKQKEDEFCLHLLETHGSQFPFWDKFKTICQHSELNLCLSFIYERQGEWEEALTPLFHACSTSFQFDRLLTFCQRHESAWSDVIQWYLSSFLPSSSSNSTDTASTIDISTHFMQFLTILPNPSLLIQSLASLPWSKHFKTALQIWTEYLQFKEHRCHFLIQLQHQERLNWLNKVITRSQGIFTISTQCYLCHESQVDLIWTSCGHVFHQRCYDRYFSSSNHIIKIMPTELCAQCEQRALGSVPTNSPIPNNPIQNEGPIPLKHVNLTTDWHEVLTEMLSKADLDYLSDIVE